MAAVFHDPDGRRWRRVRRIWLALSVLVTALAVIFIASVLANPVLPSFNLRPIPSLPRATDLKPKPPNVPANPSERKAKKAQAELQHALATTKYVVPGKRRSRIPVVPPPPTVLAPVVPATRPCQSASLSTGTSRATSRSSEISIISIGSWLNGRTCKTCLTARTLS